MKYNRNNISLTTKTLIQHSLRVFIIFSLCLIFLGTSVIAQETLEDFKEASEATFVNLIPFERLRERVARPLAKKVQDAKIKRKMDFNLFTKQKDKLLKQKAAIQKEIDDKQEEIEKYPEANDELKKEKEQLEEKLKEFEEGKIADLNEKLMEASEAQKALGTARYNLRRAFSLALRRIDRAQSNPEKVLGKDASDADVRLLKRYLAKIEREIRAEEDEHEKQERAALNKAEEYIELINKTEL